MGVGAHGARTVGREDSLGEGVDSPNKLLPFLANVLLTDWPTDSLFVCVSEFIYY